MSITEAVVDYFREELQTGRLKSGDKLPSERILIRQLGVSRFTLREALARLSALGIIQTFQGKGAFVADGINRQTLFDVILPAIGKRSSKQFSDLIDARLTLETAIVAKAAERRSQEDLRSLRDNIKKSLELIGDPVRFAELDYDFHEIIGDIADNVFLKSMQSMLHQGVERFILDNLQDLPTREHAIEDHQRIFDTIESGDPVEAERVMKQHINLCVVDYEKKQS